MASNNETTTKFKVDISELKKAMQEAKRAVAVANSEFKEAASSCDDWTKSSTGLNAKLKQLDTTLSSQKTILGALESQYEAVVREQGEGSKAADDLKIKINNQKAAINNTQREMTKYEQTLQEVVDAEKVAAKTGKDVADVLADVGEEAKDAGDGFTVLKGAVATFAGNAMTSLVGGIKNGISSLANLGAETREYRTELGKLETAFNTAGFTNDSATKTYKELYSVLGDEGQSVEAANMLAKLVDTEEELAEWTDIATGVYGTFGSSLPIESLAEAANETSKTGSITGALADALNWAGVSEDAFQESLDDCTTEQQRQALITKTLNGLYSEAATKYKETNASVMAANKANSDYADTMAQLGARVEPVMTTVKEGFNGLLQEALKLIEGVDFTAFSAKVEEAFAVLKDEVLPAIKNGFGWIIENKDILVAGLSAIAAGFVAFKIASVIQGVTTALQGMSIAQAALNAVMAANPIGLIIAAVAGLVAGFIALWNNCDEFREFWINLWDNIKKVFHATVDGIVKFFTETIPNVFKNVINFIKENWDTLLVFLINPFAGLFKYFYENNTKFKEFVDNAVTYIKELPSKIWEWLKKTIDKVTNWGISLKDKAVSAGKKLVNGIVDTVKSLPEKIKSIGSDIVRGLWNGINDMASWIGEKIKGFGEGVLGGIKSFFGINSPSKVMADEVGKWIPEGIAVGIDKNAKSVLSSMRDVTTGVVGAARDGIISGGVTSGAAGIVNNFYQTNNSPKALSRLEIYRQSKNLLGYAGGV